MRETTTFVKLDRNIMNWRWLQDPNTLAVWIYLLVNANNEARDVRDCTIERGEVECTISQIAEKMGLSARSVRTALEHLIKTGEIVKKRQTHNFTVFIIVEFDRYQAKPTNDRQRGDKDPTSSRQTADKQPTTLKEGEERKEEKKYKKYKNGERAPARVGARKESVASILDRMLAEAEAEEEAQREPSGNGTNNPDA